MDPLLYVNTILENQAEKLSRVSKLLKDWNHSDFNYKHSASQSLQDLSYPVKTRYIIYHTTMKVSLKNKDRSDIFDR